jgi:hypothetical protein
MAHNQSDEIGADPNKFGIKWDAEKHKWELIPFDILLKIIEVPYYMLSNRIYIFDLDKFNRKNVLNTVFRIISKWRIKEINTTHSRHDIHDLAIAAFGILYLIKDKAYTKEELEFSMERYRWDLFDLNDFDQIANIYTMGAKKYSANNWQRVDPERYFGALIRHLITVTTVHKFDSELGCLHLHQAIWNCMTLIWFDMRVE